MKLIPSGSSEDRTIIAEKKGVRRERETLKETRRVTECFRSVSTDEISRLYTPFVTKTTNHSTSWAEAILDSLNDSRGKEKCANSFSDDC